MIATWVVRYLFRNCLLQMVTRTKKIFVGGLSAPTTLEDVKNYFEQFGPVSTSSYFIRKFSFDFDKKVSYRYRYQYIYLSENHKPK